MESRGGNAKMGSASMLGVVEGSDVAVTGLPVNKGSGITSQTSTSSNSASAAAAASNTS